MKRSQLLGIVSGVAVGVLVFLLVTAEPEAPEAPPTPVPSGPPLDPVGSPLADPPPADPPPVEQTPIDPTPADPTPADPTLVDPTPPLALPEMPVCAIMDPLDVLQQGGAAYEAGDFRLVERLLEQAAACGGRNALRAATVFDPNAGFHEDVSAEPRWVRTALRFYALAAVQGETEVVEERLGMLRAGVGPDTDLGREVAGLQAAVGRSRR